MWDDFQLLLAVQTFLTGIPTLKKMCKISSTNKISGIWPWAGKHWSAVKGDTASHKLAAAKNVKTIRSILSESTGNENDKTFIFSFKLLYMSYRAGCYVLFSNPRNGWNSKIYQSHSVSVKKCINKVKALTVWWPLQWWVAGGVLQPRLHLNTSMLLTGTGPHARTTHTNGFTVNWNNYLTYSSDLREVVTLTTFFLWRIFSEWNPRHWSAFPHKGKNKHLIHEPQSLNLKEFRHQLK